MKFLKRSLALLLVALTLVSMVPMHAHAAGVTYYQTSKADVPIWSQASSKSTKVRTVAAAGTVLQVDGSTTNSSGNLWYKLTDNTWVFSGNVTRHSHAYSGGICTGRGCGYEYPITWTAFSGTFQVTNTSGAKVWSRPYSNNSTHVYTAGYNGVLTVTHKTTNQDGNLWYRLSDGRWVFSGNVKQRFTVSYNANGGSGAPGSQYVLSGSTLKLSSAKPARVGYTFQGWGTSTSDTTVDYKPGSSYTFTGNKTLYAIWKTCSHSYTGGICTKCKYEYPLTVSALSGTFVVTNTNGAKIWSRPYSKNSTHVRTAANYSTLTVTHKTTNQEDNLWYKLSDGNWVYSGNVKQRFTIKYNANGGSGAPGSQQVLSGSSLKLSSAKPARVGYTFRGWGTSASDTTVNYKPGSSYTFTGSKTLYAIWKTCSHSYTGGICTKCKYEYALNIKSCSGTFVVTNEDGAPVMSRPYSKNSTKLRTEKSGKALTVVNKTSNQAGNVWYQLSDGSWVYSGNVTQRYSVKFKANGGSGVPSTQYVLKGDKLKLSTKKPTYVGYLFQGWGTSASDTSVNYKPGSSYSFSGSKTLYAIWKKCPHENYTGGICDACKYVYPVKEKAHSATYVVTNTSGGKVWSRSYSKNSQNVRTEKYGAVLKVTHKVTNQEDNVWYKLSDGNWIYSGNVTQRYTIKYSANKGKGAPSAQHVLKGKTLKLSSVKPTRVGYNFQGWGTSSKTDVVSYKPGRTYTFTGSKTLYAVWSVCNHSYNESGICSRCTQEYPFETISQPGGICRVNVDSTYVQTWSRPFTGCSKVLKVYNNDLVRTVAYADVDGVRWYQLIDGSWLPQTHVKLCAYESDGTTVYKDSKVKSQVTTVSKIEQSRSSAINYMKKKVGSISKQELIPGLNKTVTRNKSGTSIATCTAMVPQGITFAGDYLLISAYCKCGSSHKSVLYVIDSSTRKYITTLALDSTCHVGGLAKLGNYIWVCDSSGGKYRMRAYRYSDIQNAVKIGVNSWYLTNAAVRTVDTKPSYVCSANGMLYVGTYYEDQKTADIHFYKPSGTKLNHKGFFTISGVHNLQGISIRGDYMVVTASYGRYTDSDAYVYKDTKGFTTPNKTYSKPIKNIKLANMVEGCYIGSSYTYFVFESGAKEYRKSPLTRPLDQYVGFANSKLGM